MTQIKGPSHCEKCPFKSRTVGVRGRVDAPIVIVGEGPGTREIIEGVPFIGPSGRLLSILLAKVGIPESDCYITNATQCLPPRSKDADGNSVKNVLMNDACKACQGRLFSEITAHPRALILAMGASASRSLTGKWGMSVLRSRGQVVEAPALSKFGILPTLHPAYILRNASALPQILSDIRKVKRIVSGQGFPKPTIKHKYLHTVKDVDRFIEKFFNRRALSEAQSANLPLRIIADIETTGLDRHNDKFRCIGLIPEHTLSLNGVNTPYIVTGKFSGTLIFRLFARMPSAVEWVWHNGKFDTSFLRAKGIPRAQCRVDQDTLLLSYSLDETGRRHSLEQCIMDHLGLPSYKDKLKAYMKETDTDYGTVDGPHLHAYCGEDTVFTGLLFQKLYKDVFRSAKRVHSQKMYYELLIPAANALATV